MTKSKGIFAFNELSLLVGELRCVHNSSQSVNEPQTVTEQCHGVFLFLLD